MMILVKVRKDKVVIRHLKTQNTLPRESESDFLDPGTVQWEVDRQGQEYCQRNSSFS